MQLHASKMQVLMILPYIACNMQNMQRYAKKLHDMQNMQTSFSICRICTAHFADGGKLRLTWSSRLGTNLKTSCPRASESSRPLKPESRASDWHHQQSGQCIYITNMQNLNSALFYILILELAYYFAYWRIYMQNNMYNMQNNMQENSALFRFCIFCTLQYAEYAEYVK